MSVTLTEIPEPMTSVIAGRPALVAGILMSAFGRSTVFHSSLACAIVAAVSCASSGETSIDTRPSTPPVASYTGRKTSAASRTSVVVIVKIAVSVSAPCDFRSRMAPS